MVEIQLARLPWLGRSRWYIALWIAAVCAGAIATPATAGALPHVSQREAIAQTASPPVKTWATARLVRTIVNPGLVTGSSNVIAVSPDNRMVASAMATNPQEYADAVRVWEIDTKRVLYTLLGHRPFVSAVAFSPNGQLLATGEYNYDIRMLVIRLWDANTGQLQRTLQRSIQPQYRNGAFYHNAILTFNPDGRTLYSTATTPIIQEWDVNTGRLRRSIVGHREVIRALRVSPDGRTLASTHIDGKISWLDLATGQVMQTLTGGLDGFELAFSLDGEALTGTFTLTRDPETQLEETRQITTWNTRTGEITHSIGGLAGRDWLLLSPDLQTFAAADHQRPIRLYDLHTGQQIRAFRGASTNIAFSPDGQLFVAATETGIKIWR
ncbi:hypothetical protein IQ268_05095 [Oculatella sp. LEGE 06141]|uniref:WD40 repeat domain-containing protein n=1 Tax=Oculatella sp. LEGE 06141 TaxID=1828648 RepID=UPI00187F04A9|nr:hypothetical protein [Oculatella sp. LEGE 06141]MBE9177959.1 hypothetical protein [Oculatella sp. LEGE 06141]